MKPNGHDPGVDLSDAEVICAWLEPNPSLLGSIDLVKWHQSRLVGDGGTAWHWEFAPLSLDLDAIRQVEQQLTEDQWLYYGTLCWKWYTEAATTNDYEISLLNRWRKALLHLSAPEKAKALAEVIRYTKPHETNPDGDRG
jgi:hypothetical protein